MSLFCQAHSPFTQHCQPRQNSPFPSTLHTSTHCTTIHPASTKQLSSTLVMALMLKLLETDTLTQLPGDGASPPDAPPPPTPSHRSRVRAALRAAPRHRPGVGLPYGGCRRPNFPLNKKDIGLFQLVDKAPYHTFIKVSRQKSASLPRAPDRRRTPVQASRPHNRRSRQRSTAPRHPPAQPPPQSAASKPEQKGRPDTVVKDDTKPKPEDDKLKPEDDRPKPEDEKPTPEDDKAKPENDKAKPEDSKSLDGEARDIEQREHIIGNAASSVVVQPIEQPRPRNQAMSAWTAVNGQGYRQPTQASSRTVSPQQCVSHTMTD